MINSPAQALATLGFRHSPAPNVLRARYRDLAIQNHPDRIIFSVDATDEERRALIRPRTETFNRISQAYLYLCPELDQNLTPVRLFNSLANRPDFFRNHRRVNAGEMYYMVFHTQSNGSGNMSSHRGEIFIKNEDDFRRVAQNHFSNAHEIEFYQYHQWRLPENGLEIILQTLENNPHLQLVTAPDNFLSEAQRARIDQHIRRNEIAHEEANRDFSISWDSHYRIYWTVLGAIAGIATALIAGLSILPMLGAMSVGALAANITERVRDKIASKYYPSVRSINSSSIEERQALLAGKEAIDWAGYVGSFAEPVAWLHPLAFHAGKNAARTQNRHLVNAIERHRPSRVR